MSSRTIFYVVDWLPPDFGAVGQYAVIFATDIAARGAKVYLVGLTSGPPSVEKRSFEGGGSLEIRRLAAAKYDKSSNSERLIWTLRANLRLLWAVIRDPRSRKV